VRAVALVLGVGTALGVVAAAGAPSGARAYDVEVEATSVFQAYEVRSPGTTAFMARRRFVQTLGLTYAERLERRPREGRLARVGASIELRLDQDFGDTCLVARDLCVRATSRSDSGAWQPLARDTLVDAPIAYVELTGLELGARARAGRQLYFDALGMIRIDGIVARVEPFPWLATEAIGGLLVRETSLAGTGAFELDGVPRLDLSEADRERASYIAEPATTWVAGAALEAGPREIRARIGYREMLEDDGLLARRAGVALASTPIEPLRLAASAVWDLLDTEVIDAMAGAELDLEPLAFHARIERHVPRFDPSTIWAYFDVAPITDAKLGTVWTVTPRLDLGLSGLARHAELSGAERSNGDDFDAGVEALARIRIERLKLELDGFAWGGSLGPLASVLVDAAYPITRRLAAFARASVWYFDDPLRAGLYGTSFSETIGGSFALTENATVRLELEHAGSRVVGQRFRALVVLAIEVWK